MKHYYLILFGIGLLAAAVFLSACKDKQEKPAVPEGQQDPVLETVTDLQSYVIIRGDEADSETVSAAVQLRTFLSDAAGFDIKLETDWVGRGKEPPVGTKEILVGATNRPESAVGDILLKDYAIAKTGERIVITGGSGEAVQNAVAWFTDHCFDAETKTVRVPAEPCIFHAEYEMADVTVDGIPLWQYTVCADTGMTDKMAAEEFADWIAQKTGHRPEVNDQSSANKILFRYADDLDLLAGRVRSGGGQINIDLNALGSSVSVGAAALTDVLLSRTADDVKALDISLGSDDAYRRATDTDIAAWRKMTDERIGEIRSAPNMPLPENGSVFYVSNSGSDANDGKTPESAWASLNKVNHSAPAGSTVLFERGGIFRGQLRTSANTTYSAYGEGLKPMLYGSPENGADPAKWTQTADDPSVWVYSTPFDEDVGTMVFNEGEAHAVKYILKAGGEDSSVTENGHTGTCINMTWGNEFSDYHDLLYDLDFWHDDQDRKIYMRSKSNPGERFSSIEFNVRHNVIAIGGDGNTIDNLCIKYGGCHGVGAGTCNDLTVQNCEFGWIGGSIQFIRDDRTVRFGNAVEIYGGCDRYSVTDCYIWQIYDAGITQQYTLTDFEIENGSVIDQKNMVYARNVIEYCNYSIEYFLGRVPEDNPSRLENFLIEDNLMWYAGTGFCEQRPDLGQGAFIKGWDHTNRASNFVIRGNLMVCSKDIMLHTASYLYNPDGSESMPELYENTIVNYDDGMYGCTAQDGGAWVPYDLGIVNYLGNKTHGDVFCFVSPDLAVETGLAPKSDASSIRPRALNSRVVG